MNRLHLLLATRNAHKRREFAQMLGEEFVLGDLSDHPEIAEVVEDGASFAENAALKAVTVSRQLPGLVLADDSGLEVDSLGGAPGIYSARYAGERATDAENRKKLLENLAALPSGADRSARFRCVLALARNGVLLTTMEGQIVGQVIDRERGNQGFGYDPIFCPVALERTMAELSASEKNEISHRALAVARLRQFLAEAGRGS